MSTLLKDIPALATNPEDVFVVHCSHEKPNNTTHFSPRVICIYVQNIDSSQSERFSLERLATKNQIPLDEIENWYDELESHLLSDFDEFLRRKSNCTFIYWVEQGEALILDVLKERFNELNKDDKKTFYIVPSDQRKSFHHLIQKIQPNSSKDLKQLIKDNNNKQVISGFLSLAEERSCFSQKEFGRIGDSVVSKVGFFIRLISENSNSKNSPNTASHPLEIESMTVGQFFKKLSIKSVLILIGLVVTLSGATFWGGFELKKYLNQEEIRELKKEKEELEENLRDDTTKLRDEIQNYTDSLSIYKTKNTDLDTKSKLTIDSLKNVIQHNK